MDKSLSRTPISQRTHIGIFGRMNAGKSSLINAFTDQPVSIVSDNAGTTTDVVRKTMEIHGIGPCVLLDTAGFDDQGSLGIMRIEAARKAAQSADLALILMAQETDWSLEKEWISYFKSVKTPVLLVLSHADERSGQENRELAGKVQKQTGLIPLVISAVTKEGIPELKEAMIAALSKDGEKLQIMGNLVSAGDVIVMVMPQDPQSPQGRLILPQVQTIREALDRECITVCTVPERLSQTLAALREAPSLIITDSQVFDSVYAQKPAQTALTSFSVLFAGYKGDIDYYMESAAAIDRLTDKSRVLIAECCTHAPLEEDIGRVKIPRLLRKKAGEGLTVDVTAGADFPDSLSSYDLVIQCGACMFNRKFVCSRIQKARDAGIPMTNYGIAIAHLKGILGRVVTGRS